MTVSVTELWDSTPVVSPITGGVLDHATVVEGLTGPLPQRGGVGVSFNCLDTAVPTTLCPPTNDTVKDFSPPGSIDAFDFAVYGGLNCKGFGFNEEEGLSEIGRIFELKESRGVERALMETRFVLGPDDDPGAGVDSRWAAAIDITPAGGPVSAKIGTAELEGYAAATYSGQPTLHLPYTIGSLLMLDNSLDLAQGGKFFTRLGAKAAIGPGYEFPNSGPDGVEAAVGTRWLYATGEVMVARSVLKTFSQRDYGTNDIYALAERRYLVAIDCFAAAIQVNVE